MFAALRVSTKPLDSCGGCCQHDGGGVGIFVIILAHMHQLHASVTVIVARIRHRNVISSYCAVAYVLTKLLENAGISHADARSWEENGRQMQLQWLC